jgi:hypothetical protein
MAVAEHVGWCDFTQSQPLYDAQSLSLDVLQAKYEEGGPSSDSRLPGPTATSPPPVSRVPREDVEGVTMTDDQKDFVVKNAFMAAMPISERSNGILFDNKVSLPRVNDIPFEQISVPTLIFQAVDDPREYQGGQEMARRIPTNQFVGLTGGHFLLTHDPRFHRGVSRIDGSKDWKRQPGYSTGLCSRSLLSASRMAMPSPKSDQFWS